MSNTILIMGESGTGKSTSIRELDPKETFIISVLNKPLPFRGYKKKYVKIDEKCSEGNYYSTDNSQTIERLINKINITRPDIKTIIIDDFQYIMGNEFMIRALEKGYGKFSEIAQHAWNIIRELDKVREDLFCYVLSHSHTTDDGIVKCKTIGKLLDDKITIEGMFTIVLHSIVIDGQYLFLTQNDGVHLAKSPFGMFEEKLIPNDLSYVNEKIKTYFGDDIQQ